MRKIASLALGLAVLVGCSDEIAIEQKELTATSNQAEEESVVQDDNNVSEESIVSEENNVVKEDNIVSEDDSVEDQNSSKEKNNIATNIDIESTDEIIEYKATVQEEIVKEGLYTHYLEVAESSNNASEETKEIVANRVDDIRVDLPTLKENSHIFNSDADVERVKLSELEKDNVLQYVEEPISNGYLIALNLPLIQKKFEAISYSLMYNENEYAFTVSERNSDFGLTVVEDVSIEQLSEATLVIMK